MKAIKYFATAVALLVTGCSKPGTAPEQEQFDRYIFFSPKVETTASLIESPSSLGQIGVVGFKYDNTNTWSAYKTDATPNVFYDDSNALVNTETVTCDEGGYGSYTPLQGWANSKKYTFFAYYPLDEDVVLVNLDGTDYTGGVPAIRYTWAADSMADVMIAASEEDLYWNSAKDNNLESTEVGFTFKHCLAGLGVNVMNASSGDVTVTSVALNLTGISNQEIIIPLDGAAATLSGTAMDAGFALALPEAGESIVRNAEKELSDKLIFIPQSSNLSIEVVVSYTREATGGHAAYSDSVTLPAVTSALTAGKKHLVNIKFTDSTVEVGGTVYTEGWVPVEDVYDTFN